MDSESRAFPIKYSSEVFYSHNNMYMKRISQLLSGRKTYICFGLFVLVCLLEKFGYVLAPDAFTAKGVLLGLGGISMRSAMNK